MAAETERGRRGSRENGCRMRKSNWDRAVAQSGAWMLGEGWKGGMRESGLVPADQEEGTGSHQKLPEKHENARTVPRHSTPCHCGFVTLKPILKATFYLNDPGIVLSTL